MLWSKAFIKEGKLLKTKKKKVKEGEIINIRMDLKLRVVLDAGKELKRHEESHQMKYIFGKEKQGRK